MYEILFQYGPFTIATFNVFLALAFVISMIFLVRFISLKKLKLSFLVNHFIYFIVFSLIGGRLFFIFEHFAMFRQNPLSALTIWDLGFSAFGIFYSTIITLYFFSKRENEDFWAWTDAFILTGLVGLIFIHIGHFFRGTHYGSLTDLPWGIAFDTIGIPFTNPIHPAQIYSALITFIIFGSFMHSVKRTHLSGIVGTLSVMLYSISAFGIDFLHGSESTYSKINFLIIAGIAFIFYIHCSHKKTCRKKSKKLII